MAVRCNLKGWRVDHCETNRQSKYLIIVPQQVERTEGGREERGRLCGGFIGCVGVII